MIVHANLFVDVLRGRRYPGCLMKPLRNRLSKKEALEQVAQESEPRTSISFYRYVQIEDPLAFREQLFSQWSELGVLGRVYVAHEGINAQISIPRSHQHAFRQLIDKTSGLEQVPFKIGIEESDISFWKLTIKMRKQIVADGLSPEHYDLANIGTHLSAKEFNEAIDNGAIVVDMRNGYESAIGHFKTAICPDVETFREELPIVRETLKGKEDQKVLLYCTGGIRCEKASAYLKSEGFTDVNQLRGGIIDYKHQVEQEGLESKFIGANFVFDGRRAEQITDDVLGSCHQCSEPTNRYNDCANLACHIMFLQCPSCETTFDGCCSQECQRIHALPEDEQKTLRRGKKLPFVAALK